MKRACLSHREDTDLVIALVDTDSPEYRERQLRAEVYRLRQQLELYRRHLLPMHQRVTAMTEDLTRMAKELSAQRAKQAMYRATWRFLFRDLGYLFVQPLAAVMGYRFIDYSQCPCCGATQLKEPK